MTAIENPVTTVKNLLREHTQNTLKKSTDDAAEGKAAAANLPNQMASAIGNQVQGLNDLLANNGTIGLDLNKEGKVGKNVNVTQF